MPTFKECKSIAQKQGQALKFLDEIVDADTFDAATNADKIDYIKQAVKSLGRKQGLAKLNLEYKKKWMERAKGMAKRAKKYKGIHKLYKQAEDAKKAGNLNKAQKLNEKADRKVAKRLDEWTKDIQSGSRAGVDSAVVSFDRRIQAVFGSYLKHFNNQLEPWLPSLTQRGKALFTSLDPEDIVREVYETGSAIAKGAGARKAAHGFAKTFGELAEALRVRANAAGMDIKKLETWNLPQIHDFNKLRGVPFSKWYGTVMDTVDVEKTMFALTGSDKQLSKKQWKKVMKGIYAGIKSQGATQIKVRGLSPAARKSLANMGQEVRILHFKDSDGWIKYNKSYGTGNPQQAMISYIEEMSRTIAALETFGPNPDAMVRSIGEMVQKETGDQTIGKWHQNIYDNIMHRNAGQYSKLIGALRGVRNIQAFSRLTYAPVAAVSDVGFGFKEATFTKGMNPFKYTAKVVANYFNPMLGADNIRVRATKLGLVHDAAVSRIKASQRYSDVTGAGTTAKIADFTIRLGGLNHMTETHQFVHGLEFLMATPKALQNDKSFKKLSQEWGETYGFTADQMALLRNTPTTTINGVEHFDPAKITHMPTQIDFMGMLHSHTAGAVPESSARVRTLLAAGNANNTTSGEFFKTAFQFSTFPVTIHMEHMRHYMNMMKGRSAIANGRFKGVGMLGTTLVATTGLGMLALQAKAKLKGQDTLDMTKPGVWVAAVRQGGSLGIYGDHIIRTLMAQRTTEIDSFLGPGLPDIINLANKVAEPLQMIITEPEEAIGAIMVWGDKPAVEKLQDIFVPVVEEFGPGLWYMKLAVDHTVREQMHSMDEDWYRKQDRSHQRRFEQYGQEY